MSTQARSALRVLANDRALQHHIAASSVMLFKHVASPARQQAMSGNPPGDKPWCATSSRSWAPAERRVNA